MSPVEHQGLLEFVPSTDPLEVEPLTHSPTDAIPHHLPTSPPRTLTNLNGLALVIGLQIGSGIFAAPSVVITKISSIPIAVSVWVLAGFLVWTGAASFIELATRVPKNGGIQEYLRHCYGDVYGFMFAWIWLLISRPCVMAMVALVFSEYLYKAVFPGEEISVWVLKGTALIAIFFTTSLNCMGTHVGTGAANFFFVLKIAGLGSIAVVGLLHGAGILGLNESSIHSNANAQLTRPPLWIEMGNLTDALLAALFSYGGWESISFVTGEIKEPQRNLPQILNLSMIIIITLFTLANITLYKTLPLETLQGTNAVAIAFGEATLGRFGVLFYAWVVCLACLGALNAIVFSTGRLTQAAGARQYIPAFLKSHAGLQDEVPQHHSRSTTRYNRICGARGASPQNIPMYLTLPLPTNPYIWRIWTKICSNAMLLNAAVAVIYVVVGSFRGLLSFKGMVEYLVYLTTVFGLLLLRLRPHLADSDPRSGIYLTPIWNPAIFCCIAALIVLRSAITHLVQVLIIIVLFGAIFAVYRSAWWRKLVDRTDTVLGLE